jgi:hypothetical protein
MIAMSGGIIFSRLVVDANPTLVKQPLGHESILSTMHDAYRYVRPAGAIRAATMKLI